MCAKLLPGGCPVGDLAAWPWRWFRTKPRERWFLICDHASQREAFVFGPFKTAEAARDYPSTFLGYVDAPAFRRATLRVERHDDWLRAIR